MKHSIFLVSSIVVLAQHCCATDGLISKLPAEGKWVSFKTKTSIQQLDGSKTESEGLLTVRSLNSVEIDGKSCRMLEFEHCWKEPVTESNSRQFHSSITKIAVLESAFARKFNPNTDIVQGVSAKTSGNFIPEKWDYQNVTKIRKKSDSLSGLGAVDFYLRPALKGPKKLGAKIIKVKKDKLTCSGVTTKETVGQPGKNKESTITFHQWKNSEVPFGVVELLFVEKRANGTSFSQEILMEDSGANAETSIPSSE